MDEEIRLDEVTIFGDKLRFLIPQEWVEEDDGEDDLYLFCAPNGESGWFRVSLITVGSLKDPQQRLREISGKWNAPSIDEETRNVIESWEKDTGEDGDQIHLFYWKVANVVPPDIVREAIFSYTVPASEVGTPETRRLTQLLHQLVSRAQFM